MSNVVRIGSVARSRFLTERGFKLGANASEEGGPLSETWVHQAPQADKILTLLDSQHSSNLLALCDLLDNAAANTDSEARLATTDGLATVLVVPHFD